MRQEDTRMYNERYYRNKKLNINVCHRSKEIKSQSSKKTVHACTQRHERQE